MTLILVLLTLGSVRASDEFSKVGTTGFVFLEIPVSARSVGLAETGIALVDAGVDGLFLNPALIAGQVLPVALGVTQSDWYVETTHQAIGLTVRAGALGVVGLQAINLDFGTIRKTRNPTWYEQGSYIDLGTYTAGAYALGLSFARTMTDRFSFGSTVKYVRETIDGYYADNTVVDIGFLYYTGFGNLRIATCLQNFGLETEYVSEKFKMPQRLTLGLASEILGEPNSSHYLTVLLEAVHPNDTGEHIHGGLEGALGPLRLRGGYKFGYEDEGLTLGFGLQTRLAGRLLSSDFAYAQHDYLDTTLRYSLMVSF